MSKWMAFFFLFFFNSSNLGIVVRRTSTKKTSAHKRPPRLATAREDNTLVLGDHTLGAITIGIQGE